MPSPVTSWNRARRLACPLSHQRSVTGHGPAQAVMAIHGPGPAVSASGDADTTARPVTVTGAPDASTTRAGSGAGYTVAGAGGGIPAGHGRSAGLRPSRTSPNGTSTTRSPGPRPPASI